MRSLLALTGLSLFALAISAAPVRAAEEILIENNIEYTNPDDQHLQVNMARPKAKGTYPGIICIHGGGFRAGDRSGYNDLVQRLAKRGYVAITVEYRLAPKYPFPAAVHDVKAAVRWLRANAKKYHVNPDKIGVTGGSAGGTLVQLLGVTEGVKELEGDGGNPKVSSKVQAVVNFYGANDFTQSYGKSVDAHIVLPLWLGGDAKQEFRRHILASPLYWVNPNATPTLIVHGTKDNYVHYEQALMLYDRMKASAVPVELVTLEGAGHGFGGKDAERAEEAMFAFFDKTLKN